MQIFRLWTARMKINQIPYVIFQGTRRFSFKFCITFSVMTNNSSEIFHLKHYMLCTKRSHQCKFFRLLSALMKVRPIPHAIFETTRSEFIQISHHCSVSWKITTLYFFSSNLIHFWQKEPIRVKFSDFGVGKNSSNS